jgi:hypothetical protein
MDKFELRPLESGLELSGRKLEGSLVFREPDAEQRAIHMIGFLSQLKIAFAIDRHHTVGARLVRRGVIV